MTAAYATAADLAEWLGTEAPADAERLLRRASELLDATVYGAYAVDSLTGLPADPDAAAALRDAACAQVEFWVEVGEAHDIDGGARSQVSIGGLSLQRPGRIADRALDLLRSAGLMSLWRSV
jgi:hypothetical protein